MFSSLKQVVLGVKRLRDQYHPGVRVDILTNSSTIAHEGVFAAFREFDSVLAKIDVEAKKCLKRQTDPQAVYRLWKISFKA